LIEIGLSPTEQMVLDFLALSKSIGFDLSKLAREPGVLENFANNMQRLLTGISRFNDPKGIYSHCLCEMD